jgi:hypothetical protein
MALVDSRFDVGFHSEGVQVAVRILPLTFLAFLFCCGRSPILSQGLDDKRIEKLTQSLIEGAVADEGFSIAVAAFLRNGEEVDTYGRLIGVKIGQFLSKMSRQNESLSIVDRQVFERFLDKNELSGAGPLSDESKIKDLRLIGVNSLVRGEYWPQKDEIRITARLVGLDSNVRNQVETTVSRQYLQGRESVRARRKFAIGTGIASLITAGIAKWAGGKAEDAYGEGDNLYNNLYNQYKGTASAAEAERLWTQLQHLDQNRDKWESRHKWAAIASVGLGVTSIVVLVISF